jgi:glycerate 2-kinase
VIARAFADAAIREALISRPVSVVAVGKAAAAMSTAFVETPGPTLRRVVAIGTHATTPLAESIEWIESGHPFPDERSEHAALRALDLAKNVRSDELLVVLLSGGASALMSAPIEGLSLADKVRTTKLMMEAGADIHALNTVRRHLSGVKGGRLAAACAGQTVTLAISDVIGDDLNAIGSGPSVPDATTWADAADALSRFTGPEAYPDAVRDVIRRGLRGELADTPKPGDAVFERSVARVIGSRIDAIEGARAAALARGYYPIVIADPVRGEAREVALDWWARVRMLVASAPRPACVISAGETTVRVTGSGRGGRNLEFALALAQLVAAHPGLIAGTSIGTDGIDGSSGVAGAIVDSTTIDRATQARLELPGRYLDANDSSAFFAPLGDQIELGRTDTNVGDLQVFLFQ